MSVEAGWCRQIWCTARRGFQVLCLSITLAILLLTSRLICEPFRVALSSMGKELRQRMKTIVPLLRGEVVNALDRSCKFLIMNSLVVTTKVRGRSALLLSVTLVSGRMCFASPSPNSHSGFHGEILGSDVTYPFPVPGSGKRKFLFSVTIPERISTSHQRDSIYYWRFISVRARSEALQSFQR